MPLNLSTFPLVPYPGRAPELALRSGMGSWQPYALLTPADRLLPFVLSRALVASNPAWVSCARVEHADTGALIADLTPTGPGVVIPPLGVRLDKYQDAPAGAEHFVYAGGIVPGLLLPCGVPLRLVLDNVWQSPRFLARADVAATCLLAEWWHDYPLYGVPYGTGLRQRLYIENGAVQFADPTTKREVTADAATGQERIDFLAKVRGGTVATEALPAYLAEALGAADAHHHFTLDGEAWKVTEAKSAKAGADGGRDSFVLSMEQTQVLIRRNCPAPLLTAAPFSADMVRPWRCGDETDTAPDWQTIQRICAEGPDGNNTGLVNWTQRDINRYSTTVGDLRNVVNAETDTTLCPLPIVYRSVKVDGVTTRDNCPSGQTGSSVYYSVPAGQFTSTANQQEADDAALNYYNANRQAYANANGTCSGSGGGTVEYRPVFTPAGCFACQMVNAADPSDVRDATRAEASLYSRATDDQGLFCVDCQTTV